MNESIIGDFRLEYNKEWGLGDIPYEVGDIVSRVGSDEQRITKIDYSGMSISVVCIKRPHDGFCEVGDEEDNVIRRYSFVRKGLP